MGLVAVKTSRLELFGNGTGRLGSMECDIESGIIMSFVKENGPVL